MTKQLPAVGQDHCPDLCKARWEIESSFLNGSSKNLKIKTFLGTSPNAVLHPILDRLDLLPLLLSLIKFQTQYKFTLCTSHAC